MVSYHRSGSRWLRCIAGGGRGCPFGGAVEREHEEGYLGIANAGGGVVRTNGKMVEVIPTDEGYMTVGENGQVAVYDDGGYPVPYSERRSSGWKKQDALNSEERRNLQDEITEGLAEDAASRARQQARSTQAWRQLSEEIDAKSQEYADAHFGEAYAFGSDEELDNLHTQRWALLSERAPEAYNREMAESYGATDEELLELDRENAKAQAILDEIEAEQSELASKIGVRQLTSSERRKRGWVATKGSKAAVRIAKAMGSGVASGVQSAGNRIADGARGEVDRFQSEAADEVSKFEKDLAKEFGWVQSSSDQGLGTMVASPSPAVAKAARAEKESRKVTGSRKSKDSATETKKSESGTISSQELSDEFMDDLFGLDDSGDDLFGVGADDDLLDDFDE